MTQGTDFLGESDNDWVTRVALTGQKAWQEPKEEVRRWHVNAIFKHFGIQPWPRPKWCRAGEPNR